ncbi:trans-2:3-enoyl-CoA reductase-like protein [Leptotrombidium deliense]|uniref:Trans-2:3-enoyl-CoA reductase-like protein n=1 Tax=Leptotrombidium deliense TaxID=299467 RepID=A0A443SJ06_9ACAR|nr:trans-2:3-enoyl-CoA reductase-like protein [Leptotrombidium deliense]
MEASNLIFCTLQFTEKSLYPDRQSLRLEAKGKALSDDTVLKTLNLKKGRILYVKDLGPQVGWKTVFLCEYFGPLMCYLITYCRPQLLYGDKASMPMHDVVHIAAVCWSFHYLKRLYETVFVHRFSHATMPFLNLFKNCGYYWGFGFYIGYYVNHPLYTPPYFGKWQIYTCLVGFFLSEIGNYSIHAALRDLRPPGTHERKIPFPTSNPFTFLFNYVSCPNYSYEFYSWIFFSAMTQCLPAALFTVAGFYQMALWALGKHKNYKKEFPKYPKSRKAIIPYLL